MDNSAERPIGADDDNILPFDSKRADGVVERGHIRLDPRKPKAPEPTKDYHPTLVYVSCSKCNVVGDIAYPHGFNYKIGDKIMDRKVFKAFCLNCKQHSEMVPLTVEMAMKNQAALLRRHYVNLRNMRNETGILPIDGDEFIRVYEKVYGENGYPPGYDVPVEGQEIPDELKHLLIRKEPNRG